MLAQDAFTGFGDPRFAADYDLLDGSPLFDAALGAPAGGLPDRDVYGRPRVFHDFLDIGAVRRSASCPSPARTAPAAIAALGERAKRRCAEARGARERTRLALPSPSGRRRRCRSAASRSLSSPPCWARR